MVKYVVVVILLLPELIMAQRKDESLPQINLGSEFIKVALKGNPKPYRYQDPENLQIMCGYYVDLDSIFIPCNQGTGIKIKNKKALKKGDGCCGGDKLVFDYVPSAFGTAELVSFTVKVKEKIGTDSLIFTGDRIQIQVKTKPNELKKFTSGEKYELILQPAMPIPMSMPANIGNF